MPAHNANINDRQLLRETNNTAFSAPSEGRGKIFVVSRASILLMADWGKIIFSARKIFIALRIKIVEVSGTSRKIGVEAPIPGRLPLRLIPHELDDGDAFFLFIYFFLGRRWRVRRRDNTVVGYQCCKFGEASVVMGQTITSGVWLVYCVDWSLPDGRCPDSHTHFPRWLAAWL